MLWLAISAPVVLAAGPPTLQAPEGLSLAEIQITGDEFIVIQNNSSATIPNLSDYWLHYFNKTDPRAVGAKGSVVQLPASSLGSGQTLLLSAIGRPTCGAAVSDSLGLSLADGGGFLEIMQMTIAQNGAINEVAGDLVSWSAGITGIIQKVTSASGTNPQPVWYRYRQNLTPTSPYLWQKAIVNPTNPCQLAVVTTSGPGLPVSSSNLAQSNIYPPASIISLNLAVSSSAKSLPAADSGLFAPQLSELLPNPKMPQTDAKDEFIELYNPNVKAFDLSNFVVEVGTTTLHKFTFGSGTLLPPKRFTIFTSASTHLSLSNSGGQAKLLDPTSKTISQSEIYDTAKEGQSWSQANGKWYWSVKPTPGQANTIDQSAAADNSNGPTASGQVAGASTYSNNQATGAVSHTPASKSLPLHPMILAAVGILAVSYGLYEYRHDLANTLERLRRHRKSR